MAPLLSTDPSAPLVNPVWGVRFFPATTLVAVLLAMFVFRSGNAHDCCLGLAAGLLVGATVSAWSISRVEWKDNTRPSDVQNLSITR